MVLAPKVDFEKIKLHNKHGSETDHGARGSGLSRVWVAGTRWNQETKGLTVEVIYEYRK